MSAEFGEALAAHRRAGRKVEFLSIGWTALESIIGIIAGVLAGSVALISFGIDSVILLGGLGLNAVFGWWWADPVAALCMVPINLREAISGLRAQPCTHEHRVQPIVDLTEGETLASHLSAVAALPAVAFLAVIHGAIFAGLFAVRFVRCK